MEVMAIARNTGVPPRKMRLVVDTVRGKKVSDALAILAFTPTPIAKILAKVIKSAAANAENNFQMYPQDLKVVRIFADEARTLRRFRAGPRGRAKPILKRSSHITVVVAEQQEA